MLLYIKSIYKHKLLSFFKKLLRVLNNTGFFLDLSIKSCYYLLMNGKQNSLIHWFPGHMTRSLREMVGAVSLIDVVLYVLDSRAPFSSLNPSLDDVVAGKPVIYVLNKADLVPTGALKSVIDKFSKEKKAIVALNASASGAAKAIMPLVEKLAKEKIEKYKAKGVKVPLRGMVIGVPNSGKSTLINNLCGKGKTVTGNKPGVTRGQQWVRATDYFELLDTPGTLYPKLVDQNAALNLAFIGSIKTEVLDILDIAAALLDRLVSLAPKELNERYKIDIKEIEAEVTESENSGYMPVSKQEIMLQKVALSRGHIGKGGVPDIEKAAVSIIDDFRKGRLGKIFLEG